MRKIVFDFDGTLLDSRKRHKAVLKMASQMLGYPLDAQRLNEYLAYKTEGANTYQFLTTKCGIPAYAAKECTQKWVAHIEDSEYLAMDCLYGDTLDTLAELKEDKNTEIILVTARKNKDGLYLQLSSLGISCYLSAIYCVSPRKAAEEKVMIAKGLGEIACWVGDTEVDRVAADSAACPFYALHRGFRSKSFWRKNSVFSHSDLSELNDYWA